MGEATRESFYSALASVAACFGDGNWRTFSVKTVLLLLAEKESSAIK